MPRRIFYIFLEDWGQFYNSKTVKSRERTEMYMKTSLASAKTLSSLLLPPGFYNAAAARRQARSDHGEGKIRRHGRRRRICRV